MKFKDEDNRYIETKLITYLMNSLVLKVFPPQEVNWDKYARQYDAVTIELKPSYKQIIGMPLESKFSDMMDYKGCKLMCDIGAGTGNLSIPLAKANPHLKVIHTDFDDVFMDVARKKASEQGLENILFHKKDAEELSQIQKEYGMPFDTIFMVHSLYSMRSKEDMEKPKRVLKGVYESLREGGHLYIADIEKEMNMAHLIYDGFKNAVKKYGVKDTINFFKELDQAKHQNANIIRKQRDGSYITQDINDLIAMLSKAGFKEENIKYRSEFEHYDNYDNVIVVMK